MAIEQKDVLEWVNKYAGVIAENRQYLIDLDSPIGDADHGENMNRGFQAALKKMPEVADKDIGSVLKMVGMTLLSTVGGAGGPLYGTLFIQMGTKSAGKMTLDLKDWCEMLEAALSGVVARGKAELGDKTMVDALTPASNTLKDAAKNGKSIAQALAESAAAAEKGMKDTIPLVARKGRASYLGERSAGHQDPGATSSYFLIKAAADTWK
ncbi:MAG: dihydroxyacetone kinase subunit L [Anaerolineales bacterium]|nr:dihydroxyacetone kinase subunit L [Anaerolineales bacterium]